MNVVELVNRLLDHAGHTGDCDISRCWPQPVSPDTRCTCGYVDVATEANDFLKAAQ